MTLLWNYIKRWENINFWKQSELHINKLKWKPIELNWQIKLFVASEVLFKSKYMKLDRKFSIYTSDSASLRLCGVAY